MKKDWKLISFNALDDYFSRVSKVKEIAKRLGWKLIPITKDNCFNLPYSDWDDDDNPSNFIGSFLFEEKPILKIADIEYEVKMISLDTDDDWSRFSLSMVTIEEKVKGNNIYRAWHSIDTRLLEK